MNRKFHRIIAYVARAALAGWAALSCLAAEDWKVDSASVRFKVRTRPPEPASAGCLAELPDGGILPRPAAETTVLNEGGKLLKSFLLMRSPRTMAILFEAPDSSETVDIYVSKGLTPKPWTPQTGLTPGLLYYLEPGAASMDAARKLAGDYTLSSRGSFGTLESLDFPGDFTGRTGPYSAYIVGYVTAKDPGRTWVAPLPLSLPVLPEVAIEGKKLNPSKAYDKDAGTGQWVEIPKEPQRIEVFHCAQSSGGKTGNMRVAWKTPNTSVEDLGGARPKDLRLAGESMWAARPTRPDEFARCGRCEIAAAESRDGTPVARFAVDPDSYFYFEDQTPVILFAFTASTEGDPEGTQYTWGFGPVAKVSGRASTSWLLDGGKDQSVTLTVSCQGKASQCAYPFYAYAPPGSGANINSPDTRRQYADVFYTMFQAVPDAHDPTAGWTPAMWDLFFRLIEPGTSKALLAHIFSKRWDVMKERMSASNRRLLEDCFFDFVSYHQPDQALKWLDKAEGDEKDGSERKAELKLKRVELTMYHLNDLKPASDMATSLAAGKGRVAELAKIRLGDIEFLSGHGDKAEAIYADVQTRAKAGGMPGAEEPKARRAGGELFHSAGEMARRRAGESDGEEGVASWKRLAVQTTSRSETIKGLLDQGYYPEAKKALEEWELATPLSKLVDDFIPIEARFYMSIGNYPRARRLYDAYLDQVQVSNFLSEAAKGLMMCMMYQKEPDEKIKAYFERIKDRFKYYPLGKEIETHLELLNADKVEREPTLDRLPSDRVPTRRKKAERASEPSSTNPVSGQTQ